LTCERDEAAAHVLSALDELPLHEDVLPGLERLHSRGFRIVTLTNGAAASAERLLESGGARPYIEQVLSVAEVRHWKPAAEAYHYAAQRCGVAPSDMTLVAVHPWDTDGAMRAGLSGAWINRWHKAFPTAFRRPDIECSSLIDLAGSIVPTS
jgi:2-haloacid dehalogenase